MSDFEWLEKIIAERTPGPWYTKLIGTTFHIMHPTNVIPAIGVKCGMAINAEFIATMGTLADKMMDVVKSAVVMDELYPYDINEGLDNANDELREALEKLKASVGGELD